MDWVPPASFDEYRLLKLLGRGSMGQVWLARDTVLDRLVAVKFLVALSTHDADHQRFLTEARAAARVQHPNIIAVYRVGEIGPRPYLISEYVRGDSLDKIARPVAWPRLLAIAIGLARGLAAAHRQGVLHRDLKPANAIVSETGEVKLLDFGLAKLLPQVEPHPDAPPDRALMGAAPGVPDAQGGAPQATGGPFVVPSDPNAETLEVVTGAGPKAPAGPIALPSVTRAGAMMGTPAYMPPEAWRGEPATPRSDIYSLGALLYELAAGAPPHRGSSPEAVRESAIAIDAPSLAIVAPGIDPGFAAIVDRCLRRDPAERFASGNAVREALEALAADGNTASSERTRPLRRRRPRYVRWAVVFGAAVAVAVLAYYRPGGRHAPASVSAAVTKEAPDVPAQDSPEASESHPLVPAGPCPAGMVSVSAGTFRMGSPDGQGDTDEHPQHEVTLSAYCIDATEVTVAAYAACVAARRCSAAPQTMNLSNYSVKDAKDLSRWCNRNDRLDHPINCIDWAQAASYCRQNGKRLPTEAEWEYAARGNDGRVYPWGNEAPSARLNMCGTQCEKPALREVSLVTTRPDGHAGWETTPVGSYPEGRSAFGVLDMGGNVAEWTADWYGRYAAQAETNPQGPRTGTSRVARGGGWTSIHTNRAADRDWPDPEDRAIDLGFRCARSR